MRLVTFLLLATALASAQTQRSTVEKRCLEKFGAPVRGKSTYGLGPSYYLTVNYDATEQVRSIEVVPKYFIDEKLKGDWDKDTNPYFLSQADYEKALASLAAVLPPGRQLQESTNVVPTSGISEDWYLYENGILHIRTYSHPEADGTTFTPRIRYFEFVYFRTVRGVVRRLTRKVYGRKELLAGLSEYRAEVNGEDLSITQCEYRKLKKGQPAVLVVPSRSSVFNSHADCSSCLSAGLCRTDSLSH